MFSFFVTIIVILVVIRVTIELRRISTRRRIVWPTDDAQEDSDNYPSDKQWAIITGATDGIGYEFARQLALNGFHLLLISRNAAKLAATKSSIMEECGRIQKKSSIQIETHVANFVRRDIYESIRTFVAADTRQISVLVNNVGTIEDLPDYFAARAGDDKMEMVSCRNENIINANLVSVTKMCEIVLPAMARRRAGLVINVSSAASLFTTPMISVYAASKAYINHLTDCLAEEYRAMGITFCLLPIWFVSTNMSHRMRADFLVPSARRYVRNALSGIVFRESSRRTGYWPHTVMQIGYVGLRAVISRSMIDRLMHWYIRRIKAYFRDRNNGPLNLLDFLLLRV